MGESRTSREYWVGFGLRLCAARNAFGATQIRLAEMLGYTRSSVANVEAGRQAVPADLIVAASSALRCDLVWLLTGEQPPGAEQPPHVADQVVKAMQALAGEKPSLRLVLAMQDGEDAKKHGALKANCTQSEALSLLALATWRMTLPPSSSVDEGNIPDE